MKEVNEIVKPVSFKTVTLVVIILIAISLFILWYLLKRKYPVEKNNKENNKNLIDWLKSHGCSDKIINDIFKFDYRDFNRLQKRIKSQPELLTAIVENGYDSEAIKNMFCYGNDKIYNTFLKYKEFVILLLENKHPAKSIIYVYDLIKHNLSPNYLKNRGDPLPDNLYFEFLWLSRCSVELHNAWTFISHNSITKIDKCRRNPQLFYLLMKNGLVWDMQNIFKRNDYETINIKNSKELLDFLLIIGLMSTDESNRNFSEICFPNTASYPLILNQNTKYLIDNDWLVSSALRTGDLTILKLVYKSTDEIKNMFEQKKEAVRDYLNNNKELTLGDDILFQLKNTKCNTNELPSLMMLAATTVIESLPKTDKIH